MYTPKFNQLTDRAVLLDAMQRYSFAIVFGGEGANGAAQATHLPLMVKDEGEHGVIEGHFAKANPHWYALAGREALVVFPGPHSYVSPANYVEELSVPTWNYIAVHAYGKLTLVEDDAGKEALVEGLVAINEPRYLEQWRSLPEGYRRTMLAGIIGFRIPVERVEGKFKLSQNRKEQERLNVHETQTVGSSDERELAGWMEQLGIAAR